MAPREFLNHVVRICHVRQRTLDLYFLRARREYTAGMSWRRLAAAICMGEALTPVPAAVARVYVDERRCRSCGEECHPAELYCVHCDTNWPAEETSA